MIKDITSIIKKAINVDILWSIDDFFKVINDNQILHSFKISYSCNDENWATISFNNEVIGYIWQKYPLIIIVNLHLKSFKKTLNQYDYIVFIGVSSLVERELSIKYDDLKDYLDFIENFDHMTAEELWFYTNSK